MSDNDSFSLFAVQRGADDPERYRGLVDCFRRIYASEGIAGFYKGILPPILAETPKRATKYYLLSHFDCFFKFRFFTFEQYRSAFSSDRLSPTLVSLDLIDNSRFDYNRYLQTLSFAGLCSGLTEAIVICPFEVVKVRLQVLIVDQQSSFIDLVSFSQNDISRLNRSVLSSIDSSTIIIIFQQQSTMAMARDIIRTQGYGTSGIYRGLTATLGRHGVWNMIYFGMYHNLKVYIPDAKVSDDVTLNVPFLLVASTSKCDMATCARICCWLACIGC